MAGTKDSFDSLNQRNPIPFGGGPNWRNMKKESFISERNKKDSCRNLFWGGSDWRNGKKNAQPRAWIHQIHATGGVGGFTTMVAVFGSVGALKNGYIRKVPLPRAPRIQSASHMQHVHDTCYYTQVPRFPTLSDLARSLAGLSRSMLRPFSLSLV